MGPNAGSDATAAVPAYLLAGGKSRRFGTDKARAVYRGRTLLETVASVLAPITSSVTVVAAKNDAYSDLGFRTLGDIVPDRGPMGGLLTAMIDAGVDTWVLLCACDWLGLRAEWVTHLLDARAPNVSAVAFKGNRIEPLFALYHTSLRDEVERRVSRGALAMHALLDECGGIELPSPEGWGDTHNQNHPFHG